MLAAKVLEMRVSPWVAVLMTPLIVTPGLAAQDTLSAGVWAYSSPSVEVFPLAMNATGIIAHEDSVSLDLEVRGCSERYITFYAPYRKVPIPDSSIACRGRRFQVHQVKQLGDASDSWGFSSLSDLWGRWMTSVGEMGFSYFVPPIGWIPSRTPDVPPPTPDSGR